MSAAAIGRFGFVLHPLYVSQFANKFPIARYLPGRFVEAVFRAVPPFEASQITGIVSPTGARAEGWFIALPWTPRVLLLSKTVAVLIAAGFIAIALWAHFAGGQP